MNYILTCVNSSFHTATYHTLELVCFDASVWPHMACVERGASTYSVGCYASLGNLVCCPVCSPFLTHIDCSRLIDSVRDLTGGFWTGLHFKINACRPSTAAFDSPTLDSACHLFDCLLDICAFLSFLQSPSSHQ